MLKSSFHDLDRAASENIGGISVLADARVLEKLRDGPPRADATWANVFSDMPPGVLQIVVKPYDGWERVVEELLPTLPEVVDGGPSAALTRGLVQAWLVLDTPPNLVFRVAAPGDCAYVTRRESRAAPSSSQVQDTRFSSW